MMNKIRAEAVAMIDALTDAEYKRAIEVAVKDMIDFINSDTTGRAEKSADGLFEIVGEYLKSTRGALMVYLAATELSL